MRKSVEVNCTLIVIERLANEPQIHSSQRPLSDMAAMRYPASNATVQDSESAARGAVQ